MARIQMSATDSVYRHNWLLVLHTVACQNCNTPCVLETDKYCKMSLVWSVHRKMWIRVRVGLGLGLRVRVRDIVLMSYDSFRCVRFWVFPQSAFFGPPYDNGCTHFFIQS